MKPFKYNPNFHTGLFRNQITFQQKCSSKDELGQDVEGDWENTTTAWAMIKTLKGREYLQAAAANSESMSRFVIPYQTGINGSMRIVYEGRIFDIVEPPINDDELNKTLTIIAREVRSGG
jgi:SPP1 family predicted phage head-tail adaptor